MKKIEKLIFILSKSLFLVLLGLLVAIALSSHIVLSESNQFIVEFANISYCDNSTDLTPPVFSTITLNTTLIQGEGMISITTDANDPDSGLWDGCSGELCTKPGCIIEVQDINGNRIPNTGGVFGWVIYGERDRRKCDSTIWITEVPFNSTGQYQIAITVYNGDNSGLEKPLCQHYGTKKTAVFNYETINVRCNAVWECPDWSGIECKDNIKSRECKSTNCGATYTRIESQSCSSGSGSSGSGSSSSGGSGGSSGSISSGAIASFKARYSAPPKDNIIYWKINSEYISLKEIKVYFDNENSSVDISVEELNSTQASKLANVKDNHLKFFTIDSTSSKITKAELLFSLPKSLLAEKNIDDSQIKLWHYKSGEWKALDTKLVMTGSTDSIFKAEVDSFSLFAISYEKKEEKNEDVKVGDEEQKEEENIIKTTGEEENKTKNESNDITGNIVSEQKSFSLLGISIILGVASLGLLIYFLVRKKEGI